VGVPWWGGDQSPALLGETARGDARLREVLPDAREPPILQSRPLGANRQKCGDMLAIAAARLDAMPSIERQARG
jgi:hypothetical protein